MKRALASEAISAIGKHMRNLAKLGFAGTPDGPDPLWLASEKILMVIHARFLLSMINDFLTNCYLAHYFEACFTRCAKGNSCRIS